MELYDTHCICVLIIRVHSAGRKPRDEAIKERLEEEVSSMKCLAVVAHRGKLPSTIVTLFFNCHTKAIGVKHHIVILNVSFMCLVLKSG